MLQSTSKAPQGGGSTPATSGVSSSTDAACTTGLWKDIPQRRSERGLLSLTTFLKTCTTSSSPSIATDLWRGWVKPWRNRDSAVERQKQAGRVTAAHRDRETAGGAKGPVQGGADRPVTCPLVSTAHMATLGNQMRGSDPHEAATASYQPPGFSGTRIIVSCLVDTRRLRWRTGDTRFERYYCPGPIAHRYSISEYRRWHRVYPIWTGCRVDAAWWQPARKGRRR